MNIIGTDLFKTVSHIEQQICSKANDKNFYGGGGARVSERERERFKSLAVKQNLP